MSANGYRSELRALGTTIIVTMAMTFGSVMATARDADLKRELHRLDRSLRDSETRREYLRRRTNQTATEIVDLKHRLVVAARRAQGYEYQASEIEQRLTNLQISAATTVESLTTRRRQLTATLAALQRLARQPKMAILTLPAGPVDSVRSALLMRFLVPNLQTRARRLGAELRALAALRGNITADRKRLILNTQSLVLERNRLVKLLHNKRMLERVDRRKSRSEQARAAKLAARARTVRELVHQLMAPRGNLRRTDMAPAPSTQDQTASLEATPEVAGGSVLPIFGRVVHQFGVAAASGSKAEGITISTHPAAHVVAPRHGTVVFAGPFRGYGRLLIIEHDEGHHVLLAGLGRIDAVVGDEVLPGEPVGAMTPSSNGTLNLYLELRRSGRPINPLPWLAASKFMVSG